jgi:hypothetical protein
MMLLKFFEKKLGSQSLDSLFGVESFGAEITHGLHWRRSRNGVMMHQISQSVQSVALMLQHLTEHILGQILSDELLSHKTK